VKRKFRLTSSTDFKRVRRFGKSYAHPFVVLIAYPNDHEISRIGFTASRSIGGAVKRNRAKRRLKAGIQKFRSAIGPGWDVILIARQPLIEAPFQDVLAALLTLIERANLIQLGDDSSFPSSHNTA
jgi:ribonuclease P protein component